MAEDQTIDAPRPVSRFRPVRDPEYIPLGVRRLRVMLSGRGETKIGDLTLGEIRSRIGRRLTNGPWLGGPSFDVDVSTSHDAPTENTNLDDVGRRPGDNPSARCAPRSHSTGFLSVSLSNGPRARL